MEKYIFDEGNGLWYELRGDYYIPCLTVPGERSNAVGTANEQHPGQGNRACES